MLYFPRIFAKICLIFLCGLVLFHIYFLSSKRFTAHFEEHKIINGTEEQYLSCLSSLPYISGKTEFISNTETTHIFNLSEQFLIFIYLGYFLIASAFILSAKLNLTESNHENK